MSYKAYIYRLRTEEDIDDLKQYLTKMEWMTEDSDYKPALLEYFYEVKKKIPIKAYRSKKVIFDYKPTDLVAALTVDRSMFYQSLIEEGELEFSSERQPRFNRLDEGELPLERPEDGYITVKNMVISEISEPPKTESLDKYLDWKKNALWEKAKKRLKELNDER